MYDKYLVTGATGFLGRAVAERLVRRRAQVYALVLQNDPYINLLPKEVHTVIGDVCAKNSLAENTLKSSAVSTRQHQFWLRVRMKNGGDFSRRFCFKPVSVINPEVSSWIRMRVTTSPQAVAVDN